MANHVVNEDGRTNYARNSKRGKHPQRIANQESTQLAVATGGSFVPLRTPEYEVYRGPTVVNLSKGASARVDADAITTPSVPRLTHFYSAGDLLCLFSFAHF